MEQIRKFGLGYCDLPTMLWNVSVMLRVLTLNIDKRNTKRLDPIFESPNYEIAFLLTTAGIVVTVYLPSNITAFLIIITGYIEAQILALSQEILDIWNDAEKLNNTEILLDDEQFEHQEKTRKAKINNFVRNRLKEIVKIHIVNINLLHQIELAFRGAIAVEFTLLSVSLTAVLLGGLENTYMQIPFGLMQVAVDCFTGQRVIDACVNFEKAVYFCKWENFDNENMKTIFLILQISQKTLTMSAGRAKLVIKFFCQEILSDHAKLGSFRCCTPVPQRAHKAVDPAPDLSQVVSSTRPIGV
ncbi:unnamed protein product, partial [Brenthis ino]